MRQIAPSFEHHPTLLETKSADPHQVADGSKFVVLENHARPREIQHRAQGSGDQQSGDVDQVTRVDHDLAHGDGDER